MLKGIFLSCLFLGVLEAEIDEVASLKNIKELEVCLNDVILDIEKEEISLNVKESESEAPK
jgi:hypothetical protein